MCLLESFLREIPLLSPWLSSTSIKGRPSLCTGAAKWLHQGFTCTFWTTCCVFKTSQLQHFSCSEAFMLGEARSGHGTVRCSCGSVCSPRMFSRAGQQPCAFHVAVCSRSIRAGAASRLGAESSRVNSSALAKTSDADQTQPFC